jgi:hypothetical protein
VFFARVLGRRLLPGCKRRNRPLRAAAPAGAGVNDAAPRAPEWPG